MLYKQRSCAECGKKFQVKIRNPTKFCSQLCYFLSRLDRSGGDDSCWLWKGYINPQTGYGVAHGSPLRNRMMSAHRLSFHLHHGKDPGRLFVLHRCDVRTCVNPRHLFLGTARDNWADSIAKGRQVAVRIGEANSRSKLTADKVREIRRSTATSAELARRFGVSNVAIGLIRRGRSWAHVKNDPPTTDARQR